MDEGRKCREYLLFGPTVGLVCVFIFPTQGSPEVFVGKNKPLATSDQVVPIHDSAVPAALSNMAPWLFWLIVFAVVVVAAVATTLAVVLTRPKTIDNDDGAGSSSSQAPETSSSSSSAPDSSSSSSPSSEGSGQEPTLDPSNVAMLRLILATDCVTASTDLSLSSTLEQAPFCADAPRVSTAGTVIRVLDGAGSPLPLTFHPANLPLTPRTQLSPDMDEQQIYVYDSRAIQASETWTLEIWPGETSPGSGVLANIHWGNGLFINEVGAQPTQYRFSPPADIAVGSVLPAQGAMPHRVAVFPVAQLRLEGLDAQAGIQQTWQGGAMQLVDVGTGTLGPFMAVAADADHVVLSIPLTGDTWHGLALRRWTNTNATPADPISSLWHVPWPDDVISGMTDIMSAQACFDESYSNCRSGAAATLTAEDLEAATLDPATTLEAAVRVAIGMDGLPTPLTSVIMLVKNAAGQPVQVATPTTFEPLSNVLDPLDEDLTFGDMTGWGESAENHSTSMFWVRCDRDVPPGTTWTAAFATTMPQTIPDFVLPLHWTRGYVVGGPKPHLTPNVLALNAHFGQLAQWTLSSATASQLIGGEHTSSRISSSEGVDLADWYWCLQSEQNEYFSSTGTECLAKGTVDATLPRSLTFSYSSGTFPSLAAWRNRRYMLGLLPPDLFSSTADTHHSVRAVTGIHFQTTDPELPANMPVPYRSSLSHFPTVMSLFLGTAYNSSTDSYLMPWSPHAGVSSMPLEPSALLTVYLNGAVDLSPSSHDGAWPVEPDPIFVPGVDNLSSRNMTDMLYLNTHLEGPWVRMNIPGDAYDAAVAAFSTSSGASYNAAEWPQFIAAMNGLSSTQFPHWALYSDAPGAGYESTMTGWNADLAQFTKGGVYLTPQIVDFLPVIQFLTHRSSIFPLPDLQAAAIGSENNVLGRVRLINLFDGAPLATAHELFRSAVHHVASFLPGGVGFADLVNGGVFNLEVQVHAEPAAITFTEDNANAAVTSQAWASFSDAGAWYVTRWQKPGQWLDLSQAMQGLSGRLSDTVTVADEDWHNGYRITFHCPLSLRSAITTDTVKVTIHVYNTAASDSSTSSQYEPEGSSTGGTVFSTSITGHGPPLDLVQSQGHFGSDTHQAILSVKSLTASTTTPVGGRAVGTDYGNGSADAQYIGDATLYVLDSMTEWPDMSSSLQLRPAALWLPPVHQIQLRRLPDNPSPDSNFDALYVDGLSVMLHNANHTWAATSTVRVLDVIDTAIINFTYATVLPLDTPLTLLRAADYVPPSMGSDPGMISSNSNDGGGDDPGGDGGSAPSSSMEPMMVEIGIPSRTVTFPSAASTVVNVFDTLP